MKLFRGVLDRDALDPERKTQIQYRKRRASLARSMSSVSAFGFSMRRSKVMDMVSIESEREGNQKKNFLESKGNDDDKDDGSRAGTPPKIL